MARHKISELQLALKTHGLRMEPGNPHGTPHWRFINSMGLVLFTVNVDDLFDGDGNRFEVDADI